MYGLFLALMSGWGDIERGKYAFEKMGICICSHTFIVISCFWG